MVPADPAGAEQGGERLARFVRPYTLTAGRTTSAVQLPLEATMRRLTYDVGSDLGTGARQVLEVCDGRSVAEIASMVSIPIGVVRVLLGDLVVQGYVQAQETLTDSAPVNDRIDLIERTLRALRAY